MCFLSRGSLRAPRTEALPTTDLALFFAHDGVGQRVPRLLLLLLLVSHLEEPRRRPRVAQLVQRRRRNRARRGEEAAGHEVRVRGRRRAAVLEVAALGRGGGVGDAARRVACADVVVEHVEARRLVFARQALDVVGAVRRDVAERVDGEVLDRGGDHVEAARGAHRGGGEVAVHAGAVPVALLGLGVEVDVDVLGLAEAQERPAGDEGVIPRLDALARADLVLPLARHHLGVGAAELQPHPQAQRVVLLGDGAAVGDVDAGAAVVRALRRRLAAVGGPPERAPVALQHVLLLKAEPRRLALRLRVVEDLARDEARVVGGRFAVGEEALAQGDEGGNVGDERVRPRRHGADDDLGVLARRLLGRRAVEVPLREALEHRGRVGLRGGELFGGPREGLHLGAQVVVGVLAGTPDVFGAGNGGRGHGTVVVVLEERVRVDGREDQTQ
mmetsp:Transcript_9169/g.28436  ORF Transcript_9169/g.28436 Transcript_9169/m.28436 type:complete len:443 (-) Transcript_9169:18-1346(-)|eukprot:CAMPEP_0174830168 /NCGR_PEP_ID=MMETSP1114-20130205/2374_1 /TAXON_ID=312471 /ORGANISM="Neobodo designis, Strain CCAP 1951/1" /LENGTH=442 /DNA_ID=CAMNT_0016063955 /DNA_START=546 /DNA_END=1874 /DNA_ORIENTATION=+